MRVNIRSELLVMRRRSNPWTPKPFAVARLNCHVSRQSCPIIDVLKQGYRERGGASDFGALATIGSYDRGSSGGLQGVKVSPRGAVELKGKGIVTLVEVVASASDSTGVR
jgi:hypothetical protein